MKLPRFTLRELFLLVVIAAMGCGWWVHAAQGPDGDTYYRAWGFDIAAERLKNVTGNIMTVDADGVLIQAGNRAERFSFDKH